MWAPEVDNKMNNIWKPEDNVYVTAAVARLEMLKWELVGMYDKQDYLKRRKDELLDLQKTAQTTFASMKVSADAVDMKLYKQLQYKLAHYAELILANDWVAQMAEADIKKTKQEIINLENAIPAMRTQILELKRRD